MANMTFKASLLPSADNTYSLGSNDTNNLKRWKINGFSGGPIEYIVGEQAAATGSWTGTTQDSELVIGKVIAYKLPFAGSGNASLTLTFTNPTGDSNSGAIPVYLNNTRVTTHYAAGSVIIMVYDGTNWRSTDYWNSNNRDAGYGKIKLTQSDATTAITTNTTQLAAHTYNETMTLTAGNKWVQFQGTNSGSNNADVLTVGHALSGVTAGDYGDTTVQTPAFNETFNVPSLSVDAAGHVTAVATHTVKIPAIETAPFVGKGSHTAVVTANEFTPNVGTATIVGNVSNTTMAHSNNANAEMIIKAHPTSGTNYYEARIGFSSNGKLYYMPVNTSIWKEVAYVDSDITGKAAGITPAGTTAQFWRGDNDWSNTLTGSFSATTITTTDTSVAAHINMSRPGGHNSPNYINVPENSALAVSIGGASGGNISTMFESTGILPYQTYDKSLGSNNYRFKTAYIGAITIGGGVSNSVDSKTIKSDSTLYLDRASSTSLIFKLNGNETARFDPSGHLIPGATNTYSLGASGTRWQKLYIGTADSYGSNTQPIWWNAGVPTAITYTANRLYYPSTITAFTAGTHFVSDTKIAINSTSNPNETLYVNGNTKIADALSINADIDTNYKLYVNGNTKISSKLSINTDVDTNYNLSVNGDSSLDGITYTRRIELRRSESINYGRIGFYAPSYVTWVDYMSNITDGAAPNGSTPSTLGTVTTWARRSLIENNATDGWIWESSTNAANSTITAQMALNASTGNLYIRGNCYTPSGSIYVGTSGDTTAERDLDVLSGAGGIRIFSHAATNGQRGIWLHAHGTGAAKAAMTADTNNNINFYGTFNGNAATATKLSTSIQLTGGDGNTDGYRLIYTQDISIWKNERILLLVKSRHNGLGLVSIGIGNNTGTVNQANGYVEIKYFGITESGTAIVDDSWQGYISADGKKGYIFWKYHDYTDTEVIQLVGPPISNGTWMTSIASSYGTRKSTTVRPWYRGEAITGAVWNDYAEFRKDNIEEKDIQEPGRCVKENGDGILSLTTKRLERGCEIISDTFGFAIGQDEENGYNTPIASSGRVLAYPYESIEEFASHIGYAVCSGPNGTVSIMTDEEEEKYPMRAIGTISEIPDYEEWGTGKVKVNGRVWIRIR